MTLCIKTLVIKRFSVTHSITAFSITAFSITAFSIAAFSITAFSITAFSITKKYDIQPKRHSETNDILPNVVFHCFADRFYAECRYAKCH
jgi:hypothetical protein